MKEELTAREFAHAFNRMCDESKCSECPFFDINCDIAVTEKENIDKIVDVVTDWAAKHPETKEELPDELLVELRPWEETLNWASEHLSTKSTDMVYGISKRLYEEKLYGKSLHIKKSRSSVPKEYDVYRLMDAPYVYIPDGFIAEIVECIPNKEKSQPKVYPKHCLVKLVPYEEALKKERETALPDDSIIHKAPWGIRPDEYDALQSGAVELEFLHHREMNDGEHSIYTVRGYHAYYIPDIFIDEVIKDLGED